MPNVLRNSVSFALRLAFLALLAYLTARSGTVSAQPQRTLRFENLSDRYAGAPSSVVTSIIQDKLGFIWIGAQYGVYRHDGQRSIVYQHDPADPHSLPGNYVYTMFNDKHDRLWLGTNNGLARYDPDIDGFTSFRASQAGAANVGGGDEGEYVTGITDDGGEGLWLGTSRGLEHLDPASGRLERFMHDAADSDSLAGDRIETIARDAGGGVWIGVWGAGLDYLAPHSKHFQHYGFLDNDGPGSRLTVIRSLMVDHEQQLWIGTETGVQRWKLGTPWDTRKALPGPAGHEEFWAFNIYQDPHDTIWLATQPAGLLQWDPDTQHFQSYQHQPADQHSLPSNRIFSVLVDRSDTLWVGSRDQGIGRADLASNGFARFIPEADASDSLGQSDALNVSRMGNVVDSLSPAGGNLVWLGGPGGVRLYDTASGHIVRTYRHEVGRAGTLSSDYVVGLLQQSDGPLWVATSEGLNRLDRQDGPFKTIHFSQKGANAIRQIVRGHNGTLWLGTEGGILHYDPANGVSKIIPYSATSMSGSGNFSIGVLLEDSRGRLWVGDPQQGVDVLDLSSGKMTSYRHDDRIPGSLPNNFVRSLYEDKNGTIWIGTLEGLVQVVEEDKAAIHFRSIGGKRLAGVYVESIESDASGMLWVAAAGGTGEASLIQVDPASGKTKSYLASDGINGGDFYDCATMHGPDGKLYFGSMQGFTAVSPEAVRLNTIPPKIMVVDLSVAGHSLSRLPHPPHLELEGSVHAPVRLTLPWDEATFSIEFTAAHFADPERNLYQYRLDGFDTGWVDADVAHRVATYTNLAPGAYRFHVKAANKNGIWGEPGLDMDVIVPPPFWATWWCRILVAAAAFAMLVAIYRARVAHLSHRQAELETLVLERTGELASKNEALSRAYSALENLSVTDPLTGLANRRFLEQKLPADLALVLRRFESTGAQAGHNNAVLFFLVDLDHFKQVNDMFGHAAGDQVLIEVAHRLRQVFRDSDYIVRWGGEEFLAVVRDSDVDKASHLAERVRATIGDTGIRLEDGNVIVQTSSVGFASYPFSPTRPRLLSWQQVVKLADLGLYAAKRGGRAAWVGLLGGPREIEEDQVEQMLKRPETALEAGTLVLQTSLAEENLIRSW